MFATLLAAEEPLTARSESEPSLSPVGLLWVLGRAMAEQPEEEGSSFANTRSRPTT